MKIGKVLFVIATLVALYTLGLLFSKLLAIILVGVGCYFACRAVKKTSFKDAFLAYLFIIPGCIIQGSLIIRWDNIYKLLFGH